VARAGTALGIFAVLGYLLNRFVSGWRGIAKFYVVLLGCAVLVILLGLVMTAIRD
jgi:hypothetical protein